MDPNSTVNWMASVGFWIASITGVLTIAHIGYTFISTINKNKLRLLVNIESTTKEKQITDKYENIDREKKIIENIIVVTIVNKGTGTKYLDTIIVKVGNGICPRLSKWGNDEIKNKAVKPDEGEPLVLQYSVPSDKYDCKQPKVLVTITDIEGKVFTTKKKI